MAEKLFTLNQTTVENAVCPPGKKDAMFFDQRMQGLALRVTKHGGKVFLAQYRAGGRVKRIVIGTFGAITPAEARERAKAYLGAAAEGRDLAAERKAKAIADKKAVLDEAFTFDSLITAWAKNRAEDRRASYLNEAVKCLNRNLKPWKSRPAKSITVKEVVKALDAIREAKGTVTANRTLSYARAAYSWALKRELVAHNPLAGVERPGRETPRERVLASAELGAIWRATEALSPLMRSYVRTLLLTLQRREEVASMQWVELAKGAASWTVPSERAKNHRATVVHLSAPVRDIIAAMPKIEANAFVFAGERKGQPVRASMGARRRLIANWKGRVRNSRPGAFTTSAGQV